MPIYTNINAWLVMGFGLGLLIFYRGLRTFRRGLIVADTPMIPIRSVAMGLTQIHGHAGGDTPFPSPVSSTPCYAFRIKIDRYGRNGWQHHRTDQNGKRFCLADESGRIHVDPVKADFDVPVHCRRMVGASPSSIFTALLDFFRSAPADASEDDSLQGRTDDELLEYAGVGYGYQKTLRFVEYCIRPDHEYDVLGTCVENSRPEDDYDRNLITRGNHNGTFLISSRSVEELEQGAGWRSTMAVMGGAALAVICAALFMAKHGLL